MITDWSTVDPDMMIARFDKWVAGLLPLLSLFRACDPGPIQRAIQLRCDILDSQLRHIAAARN
jgi:hypothetical protein